jgi:glycosyltransferase involved in cell wall biosynthesis
MGAHNHNKIILLLMIKNESKIIERCIGRALEYVDAVSILDTGSTDNTVDICEEFLTKTGKPFKISVEPFKNFGYNRTISFQKAQELCTELAWDPFMTYAMAVDADMIIKPGAGFKDFKLLLPGYTVIQHNGHLKYYNTRFMQCGYNWKCIGATHEYWSGDPTEKMPVDIFYIDDVNDGGCKSDKTERDIRLLTEEIADDPKNGRAHFYLAQSYKDLGKFEEAIKLYKKRIEIGGWFEEVWYSHYQIGKCYDSLGKHDKMELWMNRAHKYHSKRAEPFYYLTKHYRVVSDHYKAFHYLLKGRKIAFPKDDVLFIEHDVYEGLFDYENTILACYITGKTKQDSLCDVVKYINDGHRHYINNVWDNLHYYVEALDSDRYGGVYSRLLFPMFEEYCVSSCSVVPWRGRLLMNTRFVNYSIDGGGGYHMRSADGNVKTKNGFTFLSDMFYPTEAVKMMKEEPERVYPKNIEGLEDVRLFYHGDTLKFSASSKNLTDDDNIVIAVGDYDPDNARMHNIKVIQSPHGNSCEKNWISVPESCGVGVNGRMNFIYGWNPMEIGAINEAGNKLEIHTKYDTPRIFGRFRGSSALCEYEGKYYCVVHFVKYSSPRVYYHSVVQFNKDTLKPEKFSAPFCFKQTKIEYCLGFWIKDGLCAFIFSQNDCDPGVITMPLGRLRWINI